MEIFRAARVLVAGIKDIGYEAWVFFGRTKHGTAAQGTAAVTFCQIRRTHTTFQSPALALVCKCVLEEHLSEALECVVLFLFSCSFAEKCRKIYPPLYN
jgi:hypothetical protein